MGSAGGLLLSAGVIAAITQLTTDAQFAAWGWRIPFLGSIVLVAVGLVIRMRISESAEFTRLKEAGAQARMPIIEVLRTRPKNVLLAAGAAGANNVVFYTAVVFTVSYGVSELGQSRGTLLAYQFVAALVFLFTIPLFGALSDRVGRRATIGAGIVAMALFAFPYFWLLDGGSGPGILLAIVLAVAFFNSAAYSPQPAFVPELFETRIRYSGAALGFNLSSMIFGGTAPFIGAALFAWSGGTWAISLYVIVICAVSLTCVYFATDRPMLHESEGQASAHDVSARDADDRGSTNGLGTDQAPSGTDVVEAEALPAGLHKS